MYLRCKDITFSYPGSEVTVLEGISCAFTRPGFHSLFGPSGVGKSTFAKLIADQEHYSFAGQLEMEGVERILCSYNLERLPGWSSTGAHLERVVSSDKLDLKKELVEVFGIEELLNQRFHELSMGQQNRVNLIRYLLQDFDLLILDESLANVDEKLRQSIILAVKRLFPDKMFLYISHHLMEVSTFCDEIMVFGASGERKSYSIIYGQNCSSVEEIDKEKRDKTMLEIMNAF